MSQDLPRKQPETEVKGSPEAKPAPIELRNMTINYIAAEDRLQLDAALMPVNKDQAHDQMEKGDDQSKDSNQRVRLWLTRRLMDLLIKQVIETLEVAAGPAAAIPNDLRQSIAQTKAERQKERATPVKAGPSDPAWLVTKAQIRRTNQGVRLVLAGYDNQQAILYLQHVILRQWLGILQTAYRRADWSLDAFPDWMTEAPTTAPKGILLN